MPCVWCGDCGQQCAAALRSPDCANRASNTADGQCRGRGQTARRRRATGRASRALTSESLRKALARLAARGQLGARVQGRNPRPHHRTDAPDGAWGMAGRAPPSRVRGCGGEGLKAQPMRAHTGRQRAGSGDPAGMHAKFLVGTSTSTSPSALRGRALVLQRASARASCGRLSHRRAVRRGRCRAFPC